MRKKNIMMFSILIIVLLLLVACSQQSAQNNAQTKTEKEPTLTEEQAYEQLTTYLYENFGGAGNPEYATSWYNSIESIRLELEPDGQVNIMVNTTYIAGKKDKLAENTAKSIAAAIVGNSVVDVTSVTVYGQNGTLGSWSYFK